MRELTDGATAIARGALDAGCTFFAGYPITPATPILLHMVRELPKVGGIALEAEDEISAIGLCIGAAAAGARAMTATSGPGISLYSENLGMAIMMELPLVIVDVQRLGPATGGATTPAQGDVQFVRWGTSAGVPVPVLCPSNVAECYTLTQEAFAVAEGLRTPVILLTDKAMVLGLTTVEVDDYRKVPVPSRPLADPQDPAFTPYRFDPPEAVPLFAPLGGERITRFTTSTHDERGFLTKDPETVRALNEHLRRKVEARARQLERVRADLDPEARTLIVAYGTPALAAEEAAERLRAQGTRVSLLILQTLWPVPEAALARALAGAERVVVPEMNYGLYAREVERVALRTGRSVKVEALAKVDGTLISPAEIADAVG